MASVSDDEPAVPKVLPREAILAHLEDLQASGTAVYVLLARVARMKLINHAHGIRAGDELLATVGERIIAGLGGRSGTVGKLKGDVFMVAGARTSDHWLDDFSGAVASASEMLSEPVTLGGQIVRPEVNVGIATAEPGEADVDRLIIEASAAMRAAAESRSEAVVNADRKIRDEAHLETIIDRDIEQALRGGELAFAFQPLVTLADGVIHGAEALLRWQHPELGSVNPAVLFERIRVLGLADRFTRWSLEHVTQVWSDVLTDPALEGISVSINLHESQLANPNLASWVWEAMTTSGLARDAIIFEIVETGPTGLGDAAIETVRKLAADGSLLVLDDFGTGFNALDYFLRFPVHGLKFDLGLIRAIRTDDEARVIVRGVSQIAHELGVVTVAEGVETEVDAHACVELGLTLGQGWHFGRPGPIEAFVQATHESRLGLDRASVERRTFDQRPNG